jgi:hypothetical protein
LVLELLGEAAEWTASIGFADWAAERVRAAKATGCAST